MLHVALLGTGFGAEIYAPALQNNAIFRLNTVFDPDLRKAKEIRKQFGFSDATDNWKEALSGKNVNVALIATPPAVQFEMAKFALDRGLHILLASPGFMSAQECEQLSVLAAARGVTAIVDRYANYLPARRFAIDLIRNGRIGKIHSVERNFKPGVTRFDARRVPSAWQTKNSSGGGLIRSILPHDVDFLLRAVGGVFKVHGSLATHVCTRVVGSEAQDMQADDGYQVQIKFHNGALAHVNASETSASKEINEFIFHGDSGSLVLQKDIDLLIVDAQGHRERLAIPPKYLLTAIPGPALCTPFFVQAESFASAIYNGSLISPTLDEAVHVQRVLDACFTASEQERWVEIGSEAEVGNADPKSAVLVAKIF